MLSAEYPYNCPNCQKKYKRHIYFSRHKLACCPALLTEERCDVLTPVTPDMLSQPSKVMQILEYLVASNNSLKQEITDLKKQDRTKQQLDIISWLNKNFTPDQDFKTYAATIIITRKDLENIFANNLIEGLKEIFIRHFKLKDNCPYRAFEKKANTLYVFTSSQGWKILSINDFSEFINVISQGLLDEFKDWQDENYQRIFADSFSEVYLTNVKKINSMNLNTNRSQNMLYKTLYHHLKVPLNVIEYEIK
jgi:cell division protein FtsB